jgi:hypothetical protein
LIFNKKTLKTDLFRFFYKTVKKNVEDAVKKIASTVITITTKSEGEDSTARNNLSQGKNAGQSLLKKYSTTYMSESGIFEHADIGTRREM